AINAIAGIRDARDQRWVTPIAIGTNDSHANNKLIGSAARLKMQPPKTKTRARGPRWLSSIALISAHAAARTAAGAATAAARATLGTGTGAEHRLRLHRQQAFALQLLARELARTAHGFGLFAGLLLGGLFIVAAELHLAEDALALHLFLQRLESLVDIVIANENLHAASSFQCPEWN